VNSHVYCSEKTQTGRSGRLSTNESTNEGGKEKMKRLPVVLIFIIIIGVLIATLYFRSQTKETQDLANELIRKIELYKVDNGNYPLELADLIPEYYQKLPTTDHNLNNQFRYKLSSDSLNNKFFTVKYSESLGVEVSYDNRTNEWLFED
jgi:hypothetical protein